MGEVRPQCPDNEMSDISFSTAGTRAMRFVSGFRGNYSGQIYFGAVERTCPRLDRFANKMYSLLLNFAMILKTPLVLAVEKKNVVIVAE